MLALLAIATLIAGCGSSSQSSTQASTSHPPASTQTAQTNGPNSALAAKLDALCTQANVELSALYARAGKVNSYPAAAKEATEGLRIYRRYVPRFAALVPAPDERAAFARFIDTLHRQLQLSTRAAAAFAAEDRATVKALKTEIAADVQARRAVAIELGAKQCGQAPSSAGG